jgi:hypothetical protein
MVMVTTQFPDESLIISKNLRLLTVAAFKVWVDEYKQLVQVSGTDLKIDKQRRFEGAGAGSIKPEGQSATQRRIYEGWAETGVQTTYAIELPVSWEQRKYVVKNANFMNQLGQYNARSMKLVKEYDVANIINNGFTAGVYAGGDSAAYFSASHSWKSDGSAYSNLLNAVALSRDAIEAAFISMAQAKMESAIPAALMPRIINIAYQNIFSLPEILKSVKDPDNANNTYNVVQDFNIKPNLNHFLTNANSYVIDSEMNTRDLLISEDTKFDSYYDNPTMNLVERGMCAHATRFHDQLGSFGSTG